MKPTISIKGGKAQLKATHKLSYSPENGITLEEARRRFRSTLDDFRGFRDRYRTNPTFRGVELRYYSQEEITVYKPNTYHTGDPWNTPSSNVVITYATGSGSDTTYP